MLRNANCIIATLHQQLKQIFSTKKNKMRHSWNNKLNVNVLHWQQSYTWVDTIFPAMLLSLRVKVDLLQRHRARYSWVRGRSQINHLSQTFSEHSVFLCSHKRTKTSVTTGMEAKPLDSTENYPTSLNSQRSIHFYFLGMSHVVWCSVQMKEYPPEDRGGQEKYLARHQAFHAGFIFCRSMEICWRECLFVICAGEWRVH